MSEQKIYVGSGKKTSQFDIVNVSICLSDLPKEHKFTYNGKEYIKLVVAAKKEADKFGKTHYVAVDTFKPTEQSNEQKAESVNKVVDDVLDDGLPF